MVDEPPYEPHEDPDEYLPETVNHICGWCGRSAWFRRRATSWAGFWSSGYGGRPDYTPRAAGIYQCGGCRNGSLLVWLVYSRGGTHIEHAWPTPGAKEKPDLPHAEVEADRLEAWNSYLHDQYRVSVLMARTALQRAVRVLLAGPDGTLRREDRGTLASELDLLRDRGIITAPLRANADEVRLSGNDVAHPEEMGAVGRSDAEDSLTFLDDFIETTLVIPARQQARQAHREGQDAET